ncbi:MAG: glycoside-pentoside-hexuronide (GPH):cation symporter [Eubacteriales bacterium]|nr:glycoside-pentoside-hexuronide (GPH):cation symporter [Eubacteriales bacterium]
MNKRDRKNMVFFGLGTVGRDMFYAFEANAIMYFLSNILGLPLAVYAAASLVLTVLRIFDALNDPITGLIIDNTRSRFGKFKPAMLVGGVLSAAFYLVMFADLDIKNGWFVVIFGLAYILWDITYGINDIGYWSMLPSLSLEQKKREKMGAFARICANIGMFIVMVGYFPILSMLGSTENNPDPKAWFILAVIVTVLMLGFQLFTLLGVKENRGQFKQEEKTSFRGMLKVLFRNDQLMWTTVAMALFMVGYCTTTSFASYYMQYIYGDVNMYAVLAAIVGVAQIGALLIFPAVSKRMTREKLYLVSTIMVVVGYIIFFFADYLNTIGLSIGGFSFNASLIVIAVAGLVIFVAQAFIQLLMLMFLADTIEYGQWKLGKCNDSITFSIQPLINKIGAALATGFVSLAIILSGIKTSEVAAESINAGGQLIVKLVMLVIPLVFIVAGYLVFRAKFRINKETYDKIVADLRERGDLISTEQEQ